MISVVFIIRTMTSVASILVPDELKRGCPLPREVTMDEVSMRVYHSADSYGEPDIKSLMNWVVAKIPGLWYDVGIQLSIPIGVLDGFKMDIHLGGESKNCFRQTLVYWCDNRPSPYIWSVLLSSLASPLVGQKKIAEEIFTKLKKNTTKENTRDSSDGPNSVSSNDTPFVQKDIDAVKPGSDNAYVNQDSGPELEETNSETSGTASVETITFLCGCGECTIVDFLDGEIGCKHPGSSITFPLLDTSSLSLKKQMQMIDKLNSEAEEIDDEFGYLASEIGSSFHARNIDIAKLKIHLSTIEYIKVRSLPTENEQQLLNPILDRIKSSQSVSDLFILLANFWSWFNYRLLERLLKRFGNHNEKHLLEEYVSKLKHFLQRYVYEMPSSIHSPKTLDSFTKFRAKLSDKMKSAKAEELPMIQAGFARILGIEAHALILTTITSGCVELEFLAPKIIETMFPLSNEIFDEMHKLEWKICTVQCGKSETVYLRPIEDKDSAKEIVPPLPQVRTTDDDQHSVTSGSSGISGSIATEITNTNDSSQSFATASESGYSSSIPEKQVDIKKPDDQLQRRNYKGIHDICQVCLMNNPYDDSLIEDSCHDTQHHDGVYPLICATWDEGENILVPIRPLPQLTHLNGFALCNGEWCRGEKCTFAHSHLEKMAWNFELNKIKRSGRSNIFTQLPTLLRQMPIAPFCPVIEGHTHISNPKQIIRFSINRKEDYAAYNKWKGKFKDRLLRTKLKDEDLELALTADNYQEKFYVLLCFEEMEHIEILTKKCDGKYEVVMFDSVPDWITTLPYEKPQFVGCIKGITGNQIAYATQSSEGLYFVDYDNDDKDVCKANILSCNFYTVEKAMYISLISKDATRLRKCCGSTSFICDIEFEVKHGFFDTLHRAVISIPNYMILKLMPKIEQFQAIPDSELQADCIHKCLEVAGSQLTALKAIFASSSRIPILVSGPFGSGKTRILARAAYEFAMDGLRRHNTTRILICAHHPASTQTYITDYFDEISVLDNKWRREVKVVRITRGMFRRDSHYNSYFRNLSQFRREISEEKYLHEICLVIVTTYMTSLQLLSIIRCDDWSFTHILLDEAAQVREPEAIAPLCLAGKESKIVIAGDSKQVGPALVVLGQQAHENGLAVSLLERLQKKYKGYGGDAEQYLKILTDGYRCNEDITNFLSTLFYNRKVKSRVQVPTHPRAKFPFVFYCCDVDRTVRAPQEPAFDVEADAVLQQLKHYFDHRWPRDWGEQNMNDLSVITPMRNQVNLIRKKLNGQLKKVNVLPTYMIQGHEFRSVFLSTCEPLEQDGRSQDPLKSLCNPHVFNTAISRAKSLVVAIGNPFMLLKIEEVMGSRRRCWREYLRLCLKHNAVYFPDNYKFRDRIKLMAQIEAAVGMESQENSPFLIDKEHELEPSVQRTPPSPPVLPKVVKDSVASLPKSYADVAKTNLKTDKGKKYEVAPINKQLTVKDDDEFNVSSSESDSESEKGESRDQYLARINYL